MHNFNEQESSSSNVVQDIIHIAVESLVTAFYCAIISLSLDKNVKIMDYKNLWIFMDLWILPLDFLTFFLQKSETAI